MRFKDAQKACRVMGASLRRTGEGNEIRVTKAGAKTRAQKERAEAMAYYTNDVEDAVNTCRDMASRPSFKFDGLGDKSPWWSKGKGRRMSRLLGPEYLKWNMWAKGNKTYATVNLTAAKLAARVRNSIHKAGFTPNQYAVKYIRQLQRSAEGGRPGVALQVCYIVENLPVKPKTGAQQFVLKNLKALCKSKGKHKAFGRRR
jgi:hypothetical protein